MPACRMIRFGASSLSNGSKAVEVCTTNSRRFHIIYCTPISHPNTRRIYVAANPERSHFQTVSGASKARRGKDGRLKSESDAVQVQFEIIVKAVIQRSLV